MNKSDRKRNPDGRFRTEEGRVYRALHSALSKTVSDFENELFRRSTRIADANRLESEPREVTQQNVRSAAAELAVNLVHKPVSGWKFVSWISEYVMVAATGAAGNHLNEPAGILVFGVSLAIGVILVVARLTRR